MEPSAQTSFIPKKPITAGPSSYETRGISIVTIICSIIFFGAVALSVGSYLYRGILNKSLENKKQALEEERARFEISTIEDLKRLDTRIETVKSLLEKHVAVSAYFRLLEEITLKSVRFVDLSISSSGNGTLSAPLSGASATTPEVPLQFKMKGLARSYSSVALQSNLFDHAKGFREPIISDLNLDQNGNVSFSVSALIDQQVLRYREVLSSPSSKNNSVTTEGTIDSGQSR